MSLHESGFNVRPQLQQAGRERSTPKEVLPHLPADAVIWDSGGVLQKDTFRFIRDDIMRTLGIDDQERFSRGWRAAYPPFGSGELTLDQFWNTFQEAAKLPSLNLPEGENLLFRAHIQNRELLHGSYEIRDQLRELGLVNVILSNSWPEMEDYEAAAFEGFDHVFLSHHIGARKPKKEAFDPVIEYLGKLEMPIVPGRTIFIDDQEKNMAAREFGLQPILFTTPEKLAVDLQTLGLPVDINKRPE